LPWYFAGQYDGERQGSCSEGGSNPLDLAPVATSKAAKLNVFIFFDAMRVKIRDEGLVKNKAVYVALALNSDGEKRVLGLWIEQNAPSPALGVGASRAARAHPRACAWAHLI